VDPGRKRKLRLVALLGAAVLLGAALLYTSFNTATAAKTPSEVLAASESGESYELTGRVVGGSIEREPDGLRFEIRDRDGTTAVPVDYAGIVPDPFREGREVIVTGELEGGTFVAQKDSLVTKCPSKFTNAQEEQS
jgi:cytochrome c-type biogenesis protein CcmE